MSSHLVASKPIISPQSTTRSLPRAYTRGVATNALRPSRRLLPAFLTRPASIPPASKRLPTSCQAATASPSLVHFLQTAGPSAPARGAPSVSAWPLLFPLLAITGSALYAGLIGTGMNPALKMLAVATPAILMHLLIPAADALLGPRLPMHPHPSPLHSIAPALSGLAHIAACLCTYTAAATAPLNPPLLALLAYSTAMSGVITMAACHELVHSRSKVYQAVSEAVLAWMWWHPYFRQHHYHHLTICTPEDFTSALKGSSIFQFAPMYVSLSYVKAWQLSAAECSKAGQPLFSPHNRTLMGLLAQAGFTAAIYTALGPLAALIHLAVAATGLALMATFDYVLHYGLTRPLLSGSSSRFAPVSHLNSWNSLYPLENAAFFNVAMHSDHHMAASRSYPELDPREGTPLLPGPILAVALVTFIPPLWRALMDPRVDEVNTRNAQLLEAGMRGCQPMPVGAPV